MRKGGIGWYVVNSGG
jgi:hypothetical protein